MPGQLRWYTRGVPRVPSPCVLSQVTGIPMNCSVKLQLSLYIKAVRGIG